MRKAVNGKIAPYRGVMQIDTVMRPKQLYVVIRGRKTGIFDSWSGENGAESQVTGFSRSEFRGKFYHLEDAKKYFESRVASEPEIHFDIEGRNVSSLSDGKIYTTYVLTDPKSKVPFYVGQTADFEKRKNAHLSKRKKPFRKVGKYIAKLREEGLEPEFHVLETCNNLQQSLESEYKWVRIYLRKGYELCNNWKEHREIIK